MVSSAVDDLIERRSALTRGYVAERSGNLEIARQGLTRMQVLLRALGEPQLACPTVHVAGSKGKGTTTHIIAALLTSLGKKTGRYTSPHLLEWRERIAINDEPISNPALAQLLARVDAAMLTIEQQFPNMGSFSAFELLTAAAFVHFRDQHCDVAVIEVGLGGRFDSTNPVTPVVSVITRIEEEHLDVLGPTIRDIAWNKAGIIKPSTPVIVTEQNAAVDAVLAAEASQHGAPMLHERRDWRVDLECGDLVIRTPTAQYRLTSHIFPGRHNRSNIGAAVVAAELVAGQQLRSDAVIADALSGLHIPGRFERMTAPQTGRHLILDVAHTPESLKAVIAAAIEMTGARKFPILLGLLSDKQPAIILRAIAPAAEQLIFPLVSSPRAHHPGVLLAAAERLGVRCAQAASLADGLAMVEPGETPILVMGSFSIVADCYRTIAAAR